MSRALAVLGALAGIAGAVACSSGSAGSEGQRHPTLPTITAFSAAPARLSSPGSTTLSWQVAGADTVSIDHGVGAVTGQSIDVTMSETTRYTLTATNADGSSTATTTVTIGDDGGIDPPGGARFAAVVAPVDGESFLGPKVDLRLVGVGQDGLNWQASGPGGGHSQAASVQFLVDGATVLTVEAASSEYAVFKGFVKGLALSPGDHTVVARAIYSTNPGPAAQADSRPLTITVLPSPTYGQTIDLTGDVGLAQAASWVGAAASRIRVNGHGHRILATSGSTPVNWQYVDFYDLGNPSDTTSNGVDLTTTGNVTVRSCRFDYSNPVRFSLGGSASADVRGNLFRSNMRQPLGQLPYGDSYPAVLFAGDSTGPKTFAGNRVAAGWVDFQAVRRWTVGGDTDADSNVLMGPRVGIHFDYQGHAGASSDVVVRRNYSDHIYYGGWSQGNNLEAGGNATLLAERNVLVGSSWTIRGMAGEFRYNLVLLAGEDWMWLDTGAYVHHNLFVGGDNNRSGLYDPYGNTGIRVLNNTFDGLGGTGSGANAILVTGTEVVRSNLFMNMPYTPVELESGTLSADHNLFWNTDAPYYSDGRTPALDLHADPQLTAPAVHVFEYDERAVWLGTLTVGDILASYRSKYAPIPGASPVLDHGDTDTYGAGNDIGAIGGGAANAADAFGR